MSKPISIVALIQFLGLPALSQNSPGADPNTLAVTPTTQFAQVPPEAVVSPAVRMIAYFKDLDVKFDVNELVDILRAGQFPERQVAPRKSSVDRWLIYL